MRIILTLTLCLLFGVGIKAQQIYVINTVDDVTDGVCDGAHCSLREAILAANENPIGSILRFAIPNEGIAVITPVTELPAITSTNIIIDGTSLEGNAPTAAMLVLDGSNIISNGLTIVNGDFRVMGIQFQNFLENAIWINSPSMDLPNRIEIGRPNQGNIFIANGTAVRAENVTRLLFRGNYVGTNLSFEVGLGNENGVVVDNDWTSFEDAEIVIGGNIDEGESNYFVSSAGYAVNISYQGSGIIEGNVFGTGPMGTERLGNNIGVQSSNFRGRIDIGGSDKTKNIFAYNEQAVIVDRNNFTRVSENSFYCNGFSLSVIENVYPSPTIESISETSLTGFALPEDFIEIYTTDAQVCKSNHCQGMTYLGTVRADNQGAWSFEHPFLFGQQIVTLAMNNGRQSMFNDCIVLCPTLLQATADNTGPYCTDDLIELNAEIVFDTINWVRLPVEEDMTYEWTGPANYVSTIKNPIDAQVGGIYFVRASLMGCATQADSTVVQVTEISARIAEQQTYCMAESITLQSQITSNEANLTYLWTGPSGYQSTEENPSDVQESGIYNLVVSGAGCQSNRAVIELTNHFPEPLSLATEQSICLGEDISFAVPGYDYYAWESDLPLNCTDCDRIVIRPEQSGFIRLNAGLDSTCLVSTEIELEVFEAINILEEIQLCAGEVVTIFNKSVNRSGTYEQTFTASNGCDSTHRINLEVIPTIRTTEQIILCEEEAKDLFGIENTFPSSLPESFISSSGCDSIHTKEFEILFSKEVIEDITICDTEFLIIDGNTVNASGTYTNIYTGFNGCDSVHITNLTVLESHVDTAHVEICEGATINVFGEDKGEAGIFTQTFSNSLGCDSIQTISINILETINTTEERIICEGEELIVFDRIVQSAQTLERTFTGSNGCDSIHTVSIVMNQSVFTEAFLDLCSAECLELYGADICTNQKIENSFVGSNGCDSIHTTYLNIANEILTQEVINLCVGDSILSNGIFLKEAGSYTNTFNASNGCDSTHTILLSFSDAISATISTTASCENQVNGSIKLELSGGMSPFTVSIDGDTQNNIEVIDNLAEGDYELLISDINGCEMSQLFTIETYPAPNFEEEIQAVSCFGANDGVILFYSDEALMYSLENDSFSDQSEFYDLPPQEYNIAIKDTQGCIYNHSLTIEEPSELSIELPEELTINLGTNARLEPIVSIPNATYSWKASESLSCLDCASPIASPLKDTNYELTVSDANGCTREDNIWVRVEARKDLYIPNIFSPNGDGSNDLFTLLSSDESIVSVNTFRVFDRWGTLLFQAEDFIPNDENYGWNGTYRGQLMQEGVYIYYAKVTFLDDTEAFYEGDITLIR